MKKKLVIAMSLFLAMISLGACGKQNPSNSNSHSNSHSYSESTSVKESSVPQTSSTVIEQSSMDELKG